MPPLTYFRFGPENTPRFLAILIFTTIAITLSCALFNPLFVYFFGLGPEEWLSLSWYGIKNTHLWQPVTYLFVQYSGSQGINLSFLLGLASNMYIVWIMGSTIALLMGRNPFLRLYFISGILAGLLAFACMPLFGQYPILSTPIASVLAILTVWTMLNPETELLLFFLIPMKSKWLIASALGLILLITLSQLDFVNLVLDISGVIIGYLFAVLAWNLQGPFAFTHPIDKYLANIGRLFRLKKSENLSREIQTKIYDFKTGRAIIDDDKFVDAMLSKISKHGEKSLSWSERRRLKNISERKSRK
jgi:membrane associated rhomboid family serine protease